MKFFFEILKEMSSDTIAVRREFHQNPELGFHEVKTAEIICRQLDKMGVPYEKNVAQTGVVATLQGNEGGKTLLIRADMDALELVEENTFEHISKTEGKMHACGHDAHMAILLATCEVLNKLRNEFRGIVKFVFQPAEELVGGALPMIEEGVMQNPEVDACIALHVWPWLEAGIVQIMDGMVYASPDVFDITIHGVGGHGALPELCINPVTTGAEIISELESEKGNIAPTGEPFALSVCAFNAGAGPNVIPQSALIRGTVRTVNTETRKKVPAIMENLIKCVCDKYGAKYDFNYIFRYPPVINDPEISRLVHEAARQIVGENAIWGGKPSLGGEDFAYFTELVPSAIFRLGCGNKEKGITSSLHSSTFDLDEDCMDIGAAVFAAFAFNYLQ